VEALYNGGGKMSERTEPRDGAVTGHRRDGPALGFRVTEGTDSSAVAATLLRAATAGFAVYVLIDGDANEEALEFIHQHEATVVTRDPDGGDPIETVAAGARRDGLPGIVWKGVLDTTVDFEASARELQDSGSYAIEAALAPAVAPGPEVMVAIPAYNEADSIRSVIDGASRYADAVLVIDDGSTDDTRSRAREAGATVVEHESNSGYGAALKTAFEEADRADASHLVVIDGDGQHDPSDIHTLVTTQREQDAEIVIGSRFTEDASTDAPLYRRLGLFVINGLTNLSLGVVRPDARVHDAQSGFRAYDATAVTMLADCGEIDDDMTASTDILYHAHRQDYGITEVGTNVSYDVDGASSQNPMAHGATLFMNLLRTIERDRPIAALGIPGFLSTLVGVGFAYWTVTNYLTTGGFPIGLAVTSVFFTLIGMFACFTAIILHSLNTRLDRPT